MTQHRLEVGECIMPSKPNWKVVAAGDEAKVRVLQSSEPELPDGLRAVADQLIDDAEYLQSQYPARAVPVPAKKNPVAIWRRAAAAVLLIAVGAGGTLLALRLFASRESAVNPSAAHRVPLAIQSEAGALPPD